MDTMRNINISGRSVSGENYVFTVLTCGERSHVKIFIVGSFSRTTSSQRGGLTDLRGEVHNPAVYKIYYNIISLIY